MTGHTWRRRYRTRTERGGAGFASAILLVFVLLLSGATAAAALDAGTPVAPNPLLSGVGATDGQGVALVDYQHLPLDRGDALDGHATMTAWLTDAAWTWHLGLIALAIQLLGWVLGFGWIEWLLGPLEGLRLSLVQQLGAVGWAPLALAAAALIAGIVAFRGRVGAGVMQLIVSAGCFALASTIMLAPLPQLTGSTDPVADARELGRTLASAVIADVLEGPESGTIGDEASLDDALHRLETRLVDLFVREAAQEVAFGGTLAGTACDRVFTEAMRAAPPAPGTTDVLDAVGTCDPAAAAYAEQPSLWQPFTVFITSSGSLAMLGFVVALAVALLGAVTSTVLASVRAMVWVHVAILPGLGRRRFMRALADAFAALLTIVVLLVAVSAAAALIVALATRAAEAGTPLTVQMAVVSGAALAVAIGLLTVGRRLRARGRDAADAIRAFVGGDGDRRAAAVSVARASPAEAVRVSRAA